MSILLADYETGAILSLTLPLAILLVVCLWLLAPLWWGEKAK